MSNTPDSHTRRLLLKPIPSIHGSIYFDKKQKSSQATTARNAYNFTGQVQLSSIKEIQLQKMSVSSNNGQLKFDLIEDPRRSQFTYKKYMIIQKLLLLISVIWIFLCIIRVEIIQLPTYQALLYDSKIILVMNFVTLTTIFLIFMRGVTCNELHIDQKKFYCVRRRIGIFGDISRFISQKQNIIGLIGQLLVVIWHPVGFKQGAKFAMFQSYNEIMVNHDFNTIMCLVSMWRVYIVGRAMISIQIYSSPRSARLCSYNKINQNFIYTVKCLLREKPLSTIFGVFLIQQIVLAYSIRISEGFVSIDNPGMLETGFENYVNCFWCIFITMTTVGYGDYFPKTFPGRVVCGLAAFSGIILSSLMIVSVSAYLAMQTKQFKSHLALVRLKHQHRLRNQATQALIQTLKLSQHLTSQQKQNDVKKVKDLFIKLKNKIDIVKFRSRKIKSLVSSDNVSEQLSRLFEILRDTIHSAYDYQVKLKEQLQYLIVKRRFDKKKIQTIFVPHNLNLDNVNSNLSDKSSQNKP